MIVNDPEIVAEVTEAFLDYEAALLANDVTALSDFFWKSPQALRYGAGECLYGHEAIVAFRLARQGGSPHRALGRTIITTFGTDFATANTEFHRVGEKRVGRQSQTWVRMADGWRVVSAHVSLEAETS